MIGVAGPFPARRALSVEHRVPKLPLPALGIIAGAWAARRAPPFEHSGTRDRIFLEKLSDAPRYFKQAQFPDRVRFPSVVVHRLQNRISLYRGAAQAFE